MAAQQMLYDTLSTIQMEQKTGRLFLFCNTQQNGTSKRPGEFHIRHGIVAMIQFAGEQGLAALQTLRKQSIERVMFLDEQPNNSERTDKTLPTTEVILQQLGQQLPQQQDFNNQLIQHVETILAEFLGTKASSKVKEIASVYPPELQPIEFLRKCRDTVTLMMGKQIAEKRFEALFISMRGKIPA